MAIPIKFDVFESYPSQEGNIGSVGIIVKINCSDLIDYHTYHDAPSDVDIYTTTEGLQELHTKVRKALQDARNLEWAISHPRAGKKADDG